LTASLALPTASCVLPMPFCKAPLTSRLGLPTAFPRLLDHAGGLVGHPLILSVVLLMIGLLTNWWQRVVPHCI